MWAFVFPPYIADTIPSMDVDLSLNDYQQFAGTTAEYPRVYTEDQVEAMIRSFDIGGIESQEIADVLDQFETPFSRLVYPILGLVGEAGELANKLKKVARDQKGVPTSEQLDALEDELGDTMWYQAETASALGISLSAICNDNLNKLASRKQRGVLHGEGDNR